MFKRRIVRLMQNDMIFFHFYAQGSLHPACLRLLSFLAILILLPLGLLPRNANLNERVLRSRYMDKSYSRNTEG
jgi:hypothetical protein